MSKPISALTSDIEEQRRERQLLLKAIARAIHKTATPHGLHSARIVTDDYFNFDVTVRDPADGQAVAEAYAQLLADVQRDRPLHNLAFIKKNDTLSSNTIGALMLAGLISTHPDVWLPYVVVRLDRDIPRDRIKLRTASADEPVLSGRKFAVVTDHISQGDEVLEAVGVLTSLGATVTDVVTFTCRTDLYEPGQVKKFFETNDVRVHIVAETVPGVMPDGTVGTSIMFSEEIRAGAARAERG